VARFSSRTPDDLEANPLAAVRLRLGPPPYDLTESNPTRCRFPYPSGLLQPLAEPAGLHYRPDPRGPESARRAVALRYRELGLEVDPDRVVLTASTSEAYGFLFRLLADPGERVLFPTPSYPLFEQLARLEGVCPVGYRLDAETSWRIDPGSLVEASEGCRAVVVVHPNNPTGSFLHPEDALLVARLCRERGAGLIADEVFLRYPMISSPGVVASTAGGSECLSFTLDGLSKSVGLPQLKLAWIVLAGPDAEVAEALERLEYVSDAYLSVSTPVALAAPRLLELAEPVHQAIVERCRVNLQRLRKLAAEVPPVTLFEPQAGWSAVLRLPDLIDDEDLAIDLLSRRGVAVHPGSLFGFPGNGYLVLSLLPPEPVFTEGVHRTLEAIEELADRS
jgi:aspartate/methionine/tyrosine aminotransferase